MKTKFLIVVYLITGVCLGFIVYSGIELGSNIYMKCDVTRDVMDKINNETCWVYFIDVTKPSLDFVGEKLHNTNINICKTLYPVNSTSVSYTHLRAHETSRNLVFSDCNYIKWNFSDCNCCCCLFLLLLS